MLAYTGTPIYSSQKKKTRLEYFHWNLCASEKDNIALKVEISSIKHVQKISLKVN